MQAAIVLAQPKARLANFSKATISSEQKLAAWMTATKAQIRQLFKGGSEVI